MVDHKVTHIVHHNGTIHDKFIHRISMLEPKQEISFSDPVTNKETVAAAIVFLQTTNPGTIYNQTQDNELIKVVRIK